MPRGVRCYRAACKEVFAERTALKAQVADLNRQLKTARVNRELDSRGDIRRAVVQKERAEQEVEIERDWHARRKRDYDNWRELVPKLYCEKAELAEKNANLMAEVMLGRKEYELLKKQEVARQWMQ